MFLINFNHITILMKRGVLVALRWLSSLLLYLANYPLYFGKYIHRGHRIRRKFRDGVYVRVSWCPLTGTWDWPLEIAGNWDCFPKISWDFGIDQNSRIFGWDCKKLINWDWGQPSWPSCNTPHYNVFQVLILICPFQLRFDFSGDRSFQFQLWSKLFLWV